MELTKGPQHAIHIAAKSAQLGIGPEDDGLSDVFFATNSSAKPVKAKKFFASPGEYEVQGAMVDGIATGDGVVSYHAIVDGVRYAALVLQGSGDLTDAMVEKLQPADVLVLWLREGKSEDIVSLFGRVEANYLIPVQIPCSSEELAKDLQLQAEVSDKFKLSIRDISEEKRALIVLGS